MKKLVRAALALVLILGLAPTTALAFDMGEDTGPSTQANKGDITLDSSAIATDDWEGNVNVRLYLRYKGSDIITGANLSMFEISPVVDKDFPFSVTWGSNVKKLGDVKEEGYFDRDENYPNRSRSYIDFPFKVDPETVNGTYAISFKVRFLHTGQWQSFTTPVEDTIVVYVKIQNGKPAPAEATPTPPPPDATPKPQAKVILQSYVMNPEQVQGGDYFDLTMVLENTNANMAVRNMKCVLSEAKGMVLTESGSSTFYIANIPAQGTHEVTLRMWALPEAGIEPVKMTLSMEYDDRNASNTVKEDFTLPILQVIKIKVDEPMVQPTAYADDSFSVRLQAYNVGKATMYNTMVTLESDTMTADETLFAGTVEAGGQINYDVMVTVPSYLLDTSGGGMMPEGGGEMQPLEEKSEPGAVGSIELIGRSVSANPNRAIMVGPGGMEGGGGGMISVPCEGIIVISYEDNFGVPYRKEIPIAVSIQVPDYSYQEETPMYDYDYETGYLIDRSTGQLYDPVTMEPIERGINPIIPIGIGLGGVVLVVIALIVILRIRKSRRRRAEMEMEHEVD